MSNDGEVGALDPLWHSRKFLEYIQSNCVSVAVPTVCTALDENITKTKTRIRVQSHVKGKPDPYGVQFYAAVGSKNKYLFSFWDNGLGNWTGIPPAATYASVFCDLRTPVDKAFSQSKVVEKGSPSASW
jgi:Transposase IS4